MEISELIKQCEEFQEFLKSKNPFVQIETSIKELFCGEAIQKVLNIEWAKENGIYIFSSLKGRIWYIGKAAQNNFASEVWNKFSTRKAPFKHWRKDDVKIPHNIKCDLTDGNFELTLIKINNQKTEMSSLFEVYLQTFCKNTDGELPILNKKIG